MANLSALDTLIELAVKQTDEAAKLLGLAIRSGEEAQEKYLLLMQYRDEYAARCQANLSVGLTAMGFRNFQLFLEKLDQAISGQLLVVNEAQHRIEVARKAWQEGERKRMSFDTLVKRANKEELKQESKRDQKETDEQANRIAHYKR